MAELKPDDLSRDHLLLPLPRNAQGQPVLGGIAVLRRVGKGGMGAVYYGVHPRLRIEVAIKILPPHLVEEEPGLVERFFREARTAATLESEHLVRVLDVDVESGLHYMLMQFIAGESAGGYLKRVKETGAIGVPEAEALSIVKAATKGLAVAHRCDIVHRDVKPDNILIPAGRFAESKLADLGLAKPEGSAQTIATRSHVAMGTPGYMAPEQGEDARSAGAPADVFGMGATLYALLCGRGPFSGTSLAVILRNTALAEPDPLPSHISDPVRRLVSRCLAKKPEDRPPNASTLLQELEAIPVSASAVEPTFVVTPPAEKKRKPEPVSTAFLAPEPPPPPPEPPPSTPIHPFKPPHPAPRRRSIRPPKLELSSSVRKKRSFAAWVALMLGTAAAALFAWYGFKPNPADADLAKAEASWPTELAGDMRDIAVMICAGNMTDHLGDRSAHSRAAKDSSLCEVSVERISIGVLRSGPSTANEDVYRATIDKVTALANDASGSQTPPRVVVDGDHETPAEYLYQVAKRCREAGLKEVHVVRRKASIEPTPKEANPHPTANAEKADVPESDTLDFVKGKGTYDGIGVGGGGGSGRYGSRLGGKRNLVARGGGGGDTEDAVLAALKWLSRHQSADGAWKVAGYVSECKKVAKYASGGNCTPNPGHEDFDAGVTGLSLLAFLGAGYSHLSKDTYDGICFGDVVRKGLQWMMSHQDPEGCVGSRSAQKYMYNHTICALALSEAYGLTGSDLFKDSAQKAVDFTVASQNPGKGWRYSYQCGDNDSSVSGWAVMVLKSAEIAGFSFPGSAYDGTRAWFNEVTEESFARVGYNTKGTGKVFVPGLNEQFDHHEALTAIGVMSRIFMDKNKSDPRLSSGCDLLLRDKPNWSGNSIDFYYWYYASLALFQYDGPSGPKWKAWNEDMKNSLVKNQNTGSSGCKNGSWETIDRWSGEGGRVYTTAINALTLEVYYRYANVFGTK